MSKHGFLAMLAALMLACQLARGAGLQPSQTTPTTSATTVFFSVQNTTLPNGTGVGRYANGTVDYITSTTEEWVPVGMASDAAGNIVFGLNDGHGNVSLKEYTIDGKLVDLGPLFRQMGWGYWAFDLRFNPQGELCFSHYNGKDIGNGISKITADGRIEPVLQTTDIPEGFAFDRQGNLYYGVLDGSSDSFRFRLKKLSTDGVITDYGLVAWCSYTTTRWSFDLAVSPAGEVYFNHWGDSTRGTGISKLKTDGTIVSVVHTDNAPIGVSFDARGTLFFCTFNFNAGNQYHLQRLNSNGTLTDGGVLCSPEGIWDSWSFDMVVQDHPIAVISPNGGEVVHKPNLPVSWITNTALAGTSVSVELWNAAGLVRTLGTDADPSGIHTVTFDSTDIPDGQDYRIKVISGKNPQYTDMSDGPFEITSVHESVVYFTAQNDDTFGSGLGRYRDGTIDFVNQAANPEGIATDAAGNIYFCSVSEDKDWELMKYTTDGQTVDICHLWQQNGGWLSWAFDLAVNPKGEVYFDHYNGVGIGTGISKVDAQGQIQPVYTGIDPPTAMAFDRAGDLFFVTMADTTDRQYTLHKLSSAGQLTHYGVIHERQEGWAEWTFGIAISPTGEIYFNHYHDLKLGTGISKWTADGTITPVLQYEAPVGLTFDYKGTLYFARMDTEYRYWLTRLNADGTATELGYLFHHNGGWASWHFDMTIQDRPIALYSPNGGEVLRKPSLPVHWATNAELAGTSISIELWNSSGLLRKLGTDSDSDGENTIAFNSAALPDASDYKIKIISGRKPQYTDLSDGPFRIANAPAAGTNVYFSLESDVDYGTGVARLTRSNLLQFPVKVTDAAAYPVGLAVDPPGNLYYGLVHADEAGQDFSYEIVKRTTRGETVSYGTVFHPVHGDPTWALDLAASAQGELFFTHYDDPTLGTGISKIDTGGAIRSVLITANPPVGLALDRANNIYFGLRSAAAMPCTVYKLTTDATLTALRSVYTPAESPANWSFDLAVAPGGEIYFTHYRDVDRGSGISKLDSSGTTVSLVVRDEAPAGLAFDAAGTLFYGSMKWLTAADHTVDLKRLNSDGTASALGLLVHQCSRHAGWAFDLAIPNRPVVLVSPNGGEVYWRTPLTVHWRTDTDLAGTDVDIQLWRSGYWVADLETDSSPYGEHSLAIDCPSNIGDGSDYRVRVYSVQNPKYWDESDAPFTITSTPLIILAPAGGEIWQIGSTQVIHWKSHLVVTGSNMRFQLWRAGQWVADLGSQNDPDGDGFMTIVVPNVEPHNDYNVMLNSISNPNYFVYSRAIAICLAPPNALARGAWERYR